MPDPNAIGSALMKLLEGSSNQAMDWGASALGNTLAMPGDLSHLIQSAGGRMPLGVQAVGKGAGLLDEFLRGGGLTEPLIAKADALREKNPAYGMISALPPAGKTLGKGKVFSMEAGRDARGMKNYYMKDLFDPKSGAFKNRKLDFERETVLSQLRSRSLNREADLIEYRFPEEIFDKLNGGVLQDMFVHGKGIEREMPLDIPFSMYREKWLAKPFRDQGAFSDPYGRLQGHANKVPGAGPTPGELNNRPSFSYHGTREDVTPIIRSRQEARDQDMETKIAMFNQLIDDMKNWPKD